MRVTQREMDNGLRDAILHLEHKRIAQRPVFKLAGPCTIVGRRNFNKPDELVNMVGGESFSLEAIGYVKDEAGTSGIIQCNFRSVSPNVAKKVTRSHMPLQQACDLFDSLEAWIGDMSSLAEKPSAVPTVQEAEEINPMMGTW